jgi:hypothetical protein
MIVVSIISIMMLLLRLIKGSDVPSGDSELYFYYFYYKC